jgi:hypothetical protein
MLIEANPTELYSTAKRLVAARDKRRDAAARLAFVSIPELPPGIDVESAIRGAGNELRRQADELEHCAHDLAARALWAIAAGYGTLRIAPVAAVRGLWGLFSSTTKVGEQRRVLAMVRGWSFYKSEVLPWELAGRSSSPEALGAWMLWQQEISRFVPASRLSTIVEGEGGAASYLRVAAGPLRGVRVVAGKVTPFISLATSTDTLIRGSNLPGWRGDVDRYGVAPVAIGASGVAAAGVVGLIAVTPPGEVAIGVVLIGVGAWSVGNIAYDHRKEIAHAVVSTGKFVVDHPLVAGPVAAPFAAGKEVYDHRKAIAHAVVSGGDAIVHAPGKVAHAIGGLIP